MSYITIYFNDKKVFLLDSSTPIIDELKHHEETIFVDEISNAAIKSLLHEIDKPQFKTGILFNPDFDKLKKNFFKHFKFLQAGGGLVKNKQDEILLIFRNGKWDLPKGKLDKGETIEECALREVQEETGLKNVKAGKLLEKTYHTYVQFGTHFLKESVWFAMKAGDGQNLKPQEEEGISEIKWVKKEALQKYTSNMFPAIIDVLDHV